MSDLTKRLRHTADGIAQIMRELADEIERPTSVTYPVNEDQAAAMCLAASQWLSAHAPHRLRDTYKQEHARTAAVERDACIEIVEAAVYYDSEERMRINPTQVIAAIRARGEPDAQKQEG